MFPRFIIATYFLLCLSFACSVTGQEHSVRGQDHTEAIDSLKYLMRKDLPDTTRISILTLLAIEHRDIDHEKVVEYAEEALKISLNSGNEPDHQLYRILGNGYEKLGNFEKAVVNVEKAVKRLHPSDTIYIASTKDYLAYLYMRNHVFYKSIDQYKENLEYAREHDLPQYESHALAGLANVFNVIGDKEKEMQYLFQYLEQSDSETQRLNVARVEFRVGDNMREKHQYELALNHYLKAYEIAEELRDSLWMASVINRIAWNYYVMGNGDSSLSFYLKSLEIAKSIHLSSIITNSYGNIGNIYRDRNEFDEAMKYYRLSIDESESTGDLYNLSWVYEDMSNLEAKRGNYEEAYQFYKTHTLYEDSMQSRNYESRLAEARVRYEAEKNEKELELLNLKLKSNTYYTYILAGGLVLALFIGFLLIRQYRLSIRQRIAAMNHKISEMRQKNLRQQMNPHFIFNTLNSIQYYVFQNDKISSNTYMTKFASLMRKTLENSQHTSIPIKEEIEALKLYLELESLRFKEKFDWEINVDGEIDTLTYKIPTMLIQPYVENSICHGLMHKDNGKGYIKINLDLRDDHICCSIDDNGIGRQKAMTLKKKKSNNHNSLGTSITESRLTLVNSIYGKKMKIQYVDKTDRTGNPEGTLVMIDIPIIT